MMWFIGNPKVARPSKTEKPLRHSATFSFAESTQSGGNRNGYRNSSSVNNAGSNGNVWSRSLNTDNPNNAWYLNFNSDDANTNNNNRYNGYSVRGFIELSVENGIEGKIAA